MNVLQRMGPRHAPRTAVSPLERRVAATNADAADVRRAFRAWIGAVTDDDTADDLSLAVYEALANVVDHAYDDRPADAGPGPMWLHAVVGLPLPTGRDVVVTVTDEGRWRPMADPGWRGRGLSLMRRLTHVTSVLIGSGGTIVQLRRRVGPDPLAN